MNTSFVKVLVLVLVGLPHVCFGDIAWSDDPAFSSLTVPSDFSSRTSVSVPVQTDVSVYKCARGCVSNANCSSFLYHPPTRRCKYVLAVFTRKDHLVAKSGMEYWRIRDDDQTYKSAYVDGRRKLNTTVEYLPLLSTLAGISYNSQLFSSKYTQPESYGFFFSALII